MVLAANSLPAINDVTAPELVATLQQAAHACPLLAASFARGIDARRANNTHVPPPPPPSTTSTSQDVRLYVVGSGHGSPCLDLRRVSRELAEACEGVGLVVIEGMGRALHTNLGARFK